MSLTLSWRAALGKELMAAGSPHFSKQSSHLPAYTNDQLKLGCNHPTSPILLPQGPTCGSSPVLEMRDPKDPQTRHFSP